MNLRESVKQFIVTMMAQMMMNQSDFSKYVGISQRQLSDLLNCKIEPKIDTLMKLSERFGVPIDIIVKYELKENKTSISFVAGDITGKNNINNVIGGDIYQNTKVIKTYKYSYENGDLTNSQAQKIQELVNDIVILENTVKKKPRGHAAIYAGLKKKFNVPYYRKIPADQFDLAISYLTNWRARLVSMPSYKKKDEDKFRVRRYRAIFGTAKKIGFSPDEVRNYVLNKYQLGLSEISNDTLDKVYNYFLRLARKK